MELVASLQESKGFSCSSIRIGSEGLDCLSVIKIFDDHDEIVQPNKGKIRPVLDFRELNQYVSSHTAESEVCSSKLRL